MKITVFFVIYTVLLLHTEAAFVKELDDSFIEQSQTGEWLVEFYAPWCGHCKRLEPIYESVAKQLRTSPVTVGRIDCTRYTHAARHFSVGGFPTISYFNGSVSRTHQGERTEDGIIEFINKAQGPSVRKLASIGRFNEARSERGKNVFFLFIGNEDPNDHLYIQYMELAEELFLVTYFYKGSKKILPKNVQLKDEPAVLVFKDDEITEYEEAGDISTKETLREWVNRERFPLFPHASGIAINEMSQTGKFLVAAVLNVTDGDMEKESTRVKQIIESVATQRKEIYKRKFQFLWLDEVDIANSIVMAQLNLPNIIVLDPVTQFYYLPRSLTVTSLTSNSFMTFLDDVTSGKIKASGGTGFIERLKRLLYEIYTFFVALWFGSKILFAIVIAMPCSIVGLLVWCICFMSDEEAVVDPEDDDVPAISEDQRGSETKAIQNSSADGESITDHVKSE